MEGKEMLEIRESWNCCNLNCEECWRLSEAIEGGRAPVPDPEMHRAS